MNRTYYFTFCLVIFFSCFAKAALIDSLPHSNSLTIISEKSVLQQQIIEHPNLAMCDIKRIIPGIKTDFFYTRADNFTHTILYPSITTTYLRRPVALALSKVQQELSKQKLALKIWDAYRPYAITKKMWDLIKDERYVADPSKGSGHNRGIAVDLTIISIEDGKELDMGTGFDNFSDSAHHSFRSLPENVLQNRSLLRELMLRNGFVPLETEWWHYYYKEGNFEVLDLSFDSLAALVKNQSKKSGKESNEILHNSRRSQRRSSRE